MFHSIRKPILKRMQCLERKDQQDRQDGPVMALLRFPDGAEIEIMGEVVRRNYNQVALRLDKGIPYSRIMSEQLRLRNLEANGVISLPYTTRT